MRGYLHLAAASALKYMKWRNETVEVIKKICSVRTQLINPLTCDKQKSHIVTRQIVQYKSVNSCISMRLQQITFNSLSLCLTEAYNLQFCCTPAIYEIMIFNFGINFISTIFCVGYLCIFGYPWIYTNIYFYLLVVHYYSFNNLFLLSLFVLMFFL